MNRKAILAWLFLGAAALFAGCQQKTPRPQAAEASFAFPPPKPSRPEQIPGFPAPRPIEDSSAPLSPLEARWGVRIESLSLASAGYMIDFRFRVLDPEKAAPLLERGAQTLLIHEKTGARLYVPDTPKVGALRQTAVQPVARRIYFVFFSNPGHIVKKGDRVTIAIGDFQAEHLTVN